jgi:mono/diheme cytochrome c family protein
MKSKFILLVSFLVLVLAGCSFSLAEDIAPPAGYQSPTPQPTLGNLYPSQPPSVSRGAQIFTQNCLPCHGEAGLGNGPSSARLPVPVAAIGLKDISEQSSPAAWYTVISQGRQDRSMPAFGAVLTDQQRWDVLAYVYMLSSSLTGQSAQGASLYSQYCTNCHGAGGDALASANFTDQQLMSQTTGTALYRVIAEGSGTMPAFNSQLKADDIHALVGYLRSLPFELTAPAVTSAPVALTPQATVDLATTPAVTATPAPTGLGQVSGKVVAAPGASLPADITVSLHGFDTDASGSPTETLTLNGTVAADGTYVFKDVELPAGRVFLVEVSAAGMYIQSDHASVEAGSTQVILPDVTIPDTTTDASGLLVQQVHIILDFSQSDSILFYEIFVLTNPTGKAVLVTSDGTSLPFVPAPTGATPMGIQLTQDSSTVYATDAGFAIPPGDHVYSFMSLFLVPYKNKASLDQSFQLPVSTLTILAPQGVKVKGKGLTKGEPSDFGGQTYDIYSSGALDAGGSLSLSISGAPGTASQGMSTQTILVIVLGVVGLALIGVGVFMYLRDRNRETGSGQGTDADSTDQEENEDEEDEEDEETGSSADESESLMDAIIALDDQFKAGKLTKSAYQKRRAELKDQLKELL